MIDGDPVKYERAIVYSTIEELRPMVRLAASDEDHRRVLAVLTYLGNN